LREDHFKYLWAAYKLGYLAQMEPPPDPDQLSFSARLLQMAIDVREAGGELFMMLASGKPVGFAEVGIHTSRGVRRQLFPHAIWFKHATSRNRLECWLRFTVDLKQEDNVVLFAAQENWRFFDHLCKYGCIRAVGKFRGYFADGGDAMLYQGVN